MNAIFCNQVDSMLFTVRNGKITGMSHSIKWRVGILPGLNWFCTALLAKPSLNQIKLGLSGQMLQMLPSVLWHCWLGGRKGIRPVKTNGDGGGGHWLVRMEWRPAGWSVYLPLLIFRCTIKSRSSLLAPAHPGGPRKKGHKTVVVVWW